MEQVASTSDLFATRFNNKLPPVSGPLAWNGQFTQPTIGGVGPICLPTSSHSGQSVGETAGLPMQENHPDCSRMAQHALVFGI